MLSGMKEKLIKAGVLQDTLPEYPFYVSTGELSLLCGFLQDTRQLRGPIVEIGCAHGWTTIFLNKHMDLIGCDKPYICLDTFAGFTTEDMCFEVDKRGKNGAYLRKRFRDTGKPRFERTMALNSIHRVRAIAGDVKQFDFEGIRDISFAFIDVDLYQPVRAALEKVYPLMAPGGILAVHDCTPDGPYDGALQAYKEFTYGRNLPQEITYRIGLIRC